MTNDVMNEIITVNQQLTGQVKELTETVKLQAELIKQLNQTIHELKEQNHELKEQNHELKERIRELEERLNKNSKNSSKPPSSDGFNPPPSPKSLRKPSGKKAGGQKGHKGSHLALPGKPDDIIPHMPNACKGCAHYDKCKQTACITETRHVIDAVVQVKITEHQILEQPVCMLHGDTKVGVFPDNIKATIQYGENLQALAVALNTVGAVSIHRTHEILSGVFGIPIATGTIAHMVNHCAKAISGTVSKIKEQVTNAKLAHFDETGTRVDKKLWWVHSASNDAFTYLDISPKRGVVGMDQCAVLPSFSGIAVHDCFASYWRYKDVAQHAICCAHLLRELTGIVENDQKQSWASGFIDLLLEMKKVHDRMTLKKKDAISYYYAHKFSNRYDALIKQAKEENPVLVLTEKKRGRKKKGKVLALVERLEKYKVSVCLFVHNLTVPFDNNQAERDIRMIKVKTKVSGCFRKEQGARDYLKIMSYIGTAHKQGYNAYLAIKQAILGRSDFIFE